MLLFKKDILFLCVHQKSYKYKILSTRELLRGYKRITGAILNLKHTHIVWFIIFFDKLAMFNPNIYEKANLVHCEIGGKKKNKSDMINLSRKILLTLWLHNEQLTQANPLKKAREYIAEMLWTNNHTDEENNLFNIK